MLRSAAQGATANFGDEIVGLVGGDEAKRSYRDKTHKFEEERPVDTIGKGVGAVGSIAGLMFVAGGKIAALGRVEAWGNRVLQGLKAAFASVNAAKLFRVPAQPYRRQCAAFHSSDVAPTLLLARTRAAAVSLPLSM